MLGSARLLASANPNTSRCGAPPAPPTAAIFGPASKGARVPTCAVATSFAACCMTYGCAASEGATSEVAAYALPGNMPNSQVNSSSTGTTYLNRCRDIGGNADPALYTRPP